MRLLQSFTRQHRLVLRVLGQRYLAAASTGGEYTDRNYANNVSEYNDVIRSLIVEKRDFMLKDVYGDMMLDGVQPTKHTFRWLILGAMKGSHIQDALYFLEQMKLMGLTPDVHIYNFLISLYGKCKLSDRAALVLKEMKKYEVKPTAQTYICLLNARGAAGRLDEVHSIVRDMTAAGIGLNKFCYAGLILGLKNNTLLPEDFSTKILELVERSKESPSLESSSNTAENVMVGVTEEELYNMPTAEYAHRPEILNRHLTVHHAALHVCAKLGDVEVMENLLKKLTEDGQTTDIFIEMQIMRCYLQSEEIDFACTRFKEYLSSGKPPTVELYATLAEGAIIGYTHKGMQIARKTLEDMDSRGFFLSSETGSGILLAASEEKVGYTTANFVWDLMQARSVTPQFCAIEAFYKCLKNQLGENLIPKDDPRLLHVMHIYYSFRRRLRSGRGFSPKLLVLKE